MGQDFSVEDLNFLNLKPGLKLDEALEQLLTDIGKRIKRDSPWGSTRIVVYTRHRTRHGAPSINRRSYNEEELRKFEVENDGFPVPATEEEIREFDKALCPGKPRKAKKKQRSRSLTEVASLASRRLPAFSRPKFVDKLISGASNLAKRSPGKQKGHKLSLDHPRFYIDSQTSLTSDCLVEEEGDGVFDSVPEGLDDCVSEEIQFCTQCGLQILFDAGRLESSTLETDSTKVICLACERENNQRHSERRISGSIEGDLQNESQLLSESPGELRDSSDLKTNLYLDIPSVDVESLDDERHDDDTNHESENHTLRVAPREELLGPESPIIPGHVKRQCEAFTHQLLSEQDPPRVGRKVQRSSSELPILSASSSLKSLHKRPLSPQSERTDRWLRNHSSLARNREFSKAVMSKGYVKALAEQINHQGSIKRREDDDDDDDNADGGDGSTENILSPGGKDDEMRRSIVHNLIQAAERQKSRSDNGPLSPTKKANADHSGSDTPPIMLNSQNIEAFLSKTNGDIPHNSPNSKNKDTTPKTKSCKNSSHPSHSDAQRKISETHSPKSSPNSPQKLSNTSHCPSTSPQASPATARASSINRGPKPQIPPKKASLTSSAAINLRKTSNSISVSPASSSSPSALPSLTTSPDTQNKYAKLSSSSKESDHSGGTESRPSCDTNSLSPTSPTDEGVSLRICSKRNSEQYRDSVFNTIYDNAPPINAAELFDSSWSDTDSYNEFSDDDECDDESRKERKEEETSPCPAEEEIVEAKVSDQVEASPENKRRKIAEELVKTEKDYVAILHLLHQIFFFELDKENRQQPFLPADTLTFMFSNTKSIFLFHNDFLLPQLEERMKNWETDPRIGDLMKKNAPFLKLYTEYIRNFDNAMKLINQWMEKSTRFSDIIREIQKRPECHSLSLQHHMLGPIQRVPRYELLLKDYVKHLPEDSPDMKDATDALDLVTRAATHSNEAMKKIETFHKLLDIYQSLRGVPMDFISPTREFITQGPVVKIAARSGERQPRQIFLFNDLVLVCTNLLGTYSVRSQLELESMEVKPGNNMHIPGTFLVHSKQKAVELLDENPNGEIFGWEEKIKDAICKYKTRKRSIKQDHIQEITNENAVPESCLGKTAPVWIPDDAATMCMLCEITFNMMRRRHHCRSCGKLICKSCCKKAPLEYKKGKIDRVCSSCYDVIVNKRGMAASNSSLGETSPKKKGVLQVKASEPGLISAYMNCSEDNGHSWQKLWVTAHKDFVLYCFRAHEDVSAVSSLPLPGHEVGQLWDIENRAHVFCLSHKKKKLLMYQVDNDKKLKRWMTVLDKLVRAELPDETARLSSQSNSSNGSAGSDTIVSNGNTQDSTNRSSIHSGSQADSGYPGDSNNSLAALAVDDNENENADGLSQYDNVDGVVSE